MDEIKNAIDFEVTRLASRYGYTEVVIRLEKMDEVLFNIVDQKTAILRNQLETAGSERNQAESIILADQQTISNLKQQLEKARELNESLVKSWDNEVKRLNLQLDECTIAIRERNEFESQLQSVQEESEKLKKDIILYKNVNSDLQEMVGLNNKDLEEYFKKGYIAGQEDSREEVQSLESSIEEYEGALKKFTILNKEHYKDIAGLILNAESLLTK